ncbi:MAG TPA: 1-phosphofructokinase family hexose kinase [Bryobacteraceae bacterium]|nr:1-phosphofructokinase family hexose kinase [Bryobacteraceae bacterium]
MEVLILTLTVNPAIDRTITVDRLVFEDRAYITSSKESAGGRGINAASVIQSFGGKAVAILPAGGNSGACFEELLKSAGYEVVIVPVRSGVRKNLIITDKQGLTVKLNEPGATLDRAELGRLEKVVREKLAQASWFMICGSLPPGVPAGFYPRLIAAAHKQGVKTLLDTDGDALEAGIAAKPTVVTPNQQEAERLLNTALLTRTHFLQAALRIRRMGAESVLLSLGNRGAVAAFNHEIVEAVPPRVDAIAPIGAGDAMHAAFAWSMERDNDYRDALRWGVAAGTASAKLPGMRFATLEQTQEIYRQVEVRQAD